MSAAYIVPDSLVNSGSGLYDQGFAEGVIDSLDFDYFSEYVDKVNKVNWYCIEGGTQLVPNAMNKRLRTPLTDKDLGKRVTKIAENKTKDIMEVKLYGEKKPREYMSVFATPTLACLQRIDLTELGLLYEQKDAIRSLHYDTASKVGMKFKRAWWIELGIKGGLGKTDMPLRTWYALRSFLDATTDDTVSTPRTISTTKAKPSCYVPTL